MKKTNRLVTVEQGWPVCSIGAEIAAQVVEQAFDYLDAPPLKITGKDVPMPYAANLEKLALPTVDDVVAAAKSVRLSRVTMAQARNDLSWKKGGCHCGAVRFEVLVPGRDRSAGLQLLDLPHDGLSSPHRSAVAFPPAHRRRTTDGYTFNTNSAKHLFCSICGIKSFYVPRSHPDGYSVNFRCLNAEDFRSVLTTEFDGRNWEQHIDELAPLDDGR